MTTKIEFSDNAIGTWMRDNGPCEDSTGTHGFSFMIPPGSYEREVILTREELLLMLAEIDEQYPVAELFPGTRDTLDRLSHTGKK